MKTTLKSLAILLTVFLISCGGKEEKKKEKIKISTKTEKKAEETIEKLPVSKTIDLSNKGIGPITSIELPQAIDKKLANQGENLFKTKCAVCHRIDKKFIGPPVAGILERRTPEWVMNMILNPIEMATKDPLASATMKEYNGAMMTNQGLTEKDAKSLLEYFRTLK